MVKLPAEIQAGPKSKQSKLFGSLARTILAGIIIGASLGALYWWHVNGQLQKTIRELHIKEGRVVRYDLVRGRYAKIETGCPFTVRAFVRETKTRNWIPTEEQGLVRAIMQWCPDQDRWIEEPHDALPMSQRARLEALIRAPANEGLIDALEDEDHWTREVAFHELLSRASQTFDYQPNGPEKDRQAAVARWREWWETNRTRWTAEPGRTR